MSYCGLADNALGWRKFASIIHVDKRTGQKGPDTLGPDLMRERARSRIQDGGPQKRSASTVPFLPFNTDFSTRN